MALKDIVPFQFKPGQSGNPNSSRDYHHRRRAAREVSTECLSRISSVLFDGSLNELRELGESPTVTPIEKLMIAVVIKAFDRGDAQAVNLLLDRFIGRTQANGVGDQKDNGEVSFASMSDEDLRQRSALLHRVQSEDSKLPLHVREAHAVLAHPNVV